MPDHKFEPFDRMLVRDSNEDDYSPPTSSHGYEWGDSVEVFVRGKWHYGIFIFDDGRDVCPYAVIVRGECKNSWYEHNEVRPFKPAGREETAAQ